MNHEELDALLEQICLSLTKVIIWETSEGNRNELVALRARVEQYIREEKGY
jgi:hypothetical protein